jgi:hypothetical protein
MRGTLEGDSNIVGTNKSNQVYLLRADRERKIPLNSELFKQISIKQQQRQQQPQPPPPQQPQEQQQINSISS